MASLYPSQSNRPYGPSHARTDKRARVEDVPEEQRPGGHSNDLSGSRAQFQGETQHGHPSGEALHVQFQQPKQQDNHGGNSLGGGHATKQPSRDQKEEQKPQGNAEPQTHEQFSAPGVGATPQNPGVFLHTSANPTMALGYSQGYSFLPNQVIATQGSAGANANLQFQPAMGSTHQHTLQDPSPGANLPLNTTYIGAPNMAYYRNMDFQHGAPSHPQGLHFQPPVPDTSYGPMTHIYVPRYDGVGPPGSPAQVPLQPQIAVSTNPNTLTVHHQAPIPTVQPHVAAQPGVLVGGGVMPGTYPTQPAQNPVMYAAGGPGMVPGVQGVPGSVTAHLPPDVTGIGKTIAEIQAYHQDVATANNVMEPEDFQPASTDPAKMYYCRELDGNWTLRSRYSIDKMGDWRWYQTPEGIFYAVRLPN